MERTGIHIFRRDLRLEDNTALNALARHVDRVLPVFIFDPRQVGEHAYRSTAGLQVLCESLADLDHELAKRGSALLTEEGIAKEVLASLISRYRPVAVSYNRDYTPFSVMRDQTIDEVAKAHGVEVISEHDVTLHPPGSVVTKDGRPYSVYTRYRIAVEARPLPTPVTEPVTFVPPEGESRLKEITSRLVPAPRTLRVAGGRAVGQELLSALTHNRRYAHDRDFPAIPATSGLSAHIKFGTVSIREVYAYAKEHMPQPTTFLSELLWHDFFTTVAALAPHVYEGAYRKEFNSIRWSADEEAFTRFKEGRTGFPIVDAGMRELRETGYMHNRVRMITASFLVKDLHINWQWGERYFAQMLADYDPAVNNGNWQWVAGTGCDAAPWFRIFNPWLQQKRFDAACEYTKRWVPELASVTARDIHDPAGAARLAAGYPLPMCDHAVEAKKTKEAFGNIR